MKVIRPIQNLIDELRRLPTIGPKTAARLTYFLLKAPEEESIRLAEAIKELKDKTVICRECFNVSEVSPCTICTDSDRDASVICVVEEPLDVLAVERSSSFAGVYHVLGGAIDPLAGFGPEELRIQQLMERLRCSEVDEVVLATNLSVEGEATAMYIKKRIENAQSEGVIPGAIRLTRIARGLPSGGDLEYADKVTLGRAIEGRREF